MAAAAIEIRYRMIVVLAGFDESGRAGIGAPA